MATCRQKIDRDKYENIIRNFNHYLSITEEQDHTPDQYFDDYGVRMDKDIHGKVLLDLQRLHRKVISGQNVLATNIKRTYAAIVFSQFKQRLQRR